MCCVIPLYFIHVAQRSHECSLMQHNTILPYVTVTLSGLWLLKSLKFFGGRGGGSLGMSVCYLEEKKVLIFLCLWDVNIEIWSRLRMRSGRRRRIIISRLRKSKMSFSSPWWSLSMAINTLTVSVTLLVVKISDISERCAKKREWGELWRRRGKLPVKKDNVLSCSHVGPAMLIITCTWLRKHLFIYQLRLGPQSLLAASLIGVIFQKVFEYVLVSEF